MKVAIVGGGVIGCAAALELARHGHAVTLMDRGQFGAEASSAAAGMLGAQIESEHASPQVDIFLRARDAYPKWVENLHTQTGIEVGYRACGALRIAKTAAEEEEVARHVSWQAASGLPARLLTLSEALLVEPELAGDVRAAAYFPDDAQVDPPRLMRALIAAVTQKKVDVQSGCNVERFIIEEGRCVGVAHAAGEVRADVALLAAGSWSSLLKGLPVAPAIRPARGQIVQLNEPVPRVRTIVYGRHCYVVPRGDGRVICGSTMEFVGFRREVTAGGVHAIVSGALDSIPGLASAHFSAAWCNFRPHSALDAPLIGPSTVPGLMFATGHHRNGILLAQATAEAVANAVSALAR